MGLYSVEWLQEWGKILDGDAAKIKMELPPGWVLENGVARTTRDFLIHHLLRIRTKERQLKPLTLNRAQAEYSRHCTKKNIILKARQLGITTYVASRFFIQTITQPGTVSLQVAHDQESAEDIFRIVHRFRENLPEALRQGALRTSRDNVRQLAFSHLDSEYRVATAADEDAGRGTTVHNLHCSEVARWSGDPLETLVSLRAAVPQEGEIVLESTPNGAGGLFYDEWERALETGYTRHFFPWWYEPAYVMDAQLAGLGCYTEEEQGLMDKENLTAEQIAWRRVQWAQLRKMASQEYAEDPTSCFRASGECVFDLELVEKAMKDAPTPVEDKDNGCWRVWLPPQSGKQYIVGVDPAGGGTDGDYACAEIIEREGGLQCAELRGHYALRELAEKVVEIAHQYNDALLSIERNNHGHGVLVHVDGFQYKNVYCDSGKAGWLTDRVSRPAMIEELVKLLNEHPELFKSRRLLEEFRTFVRKKDGSSSAQNGAHDDCVMAMAIAFGTRKRCPADN